MRTENLANAIDKFQDQENIHGIEGRRGVVTLAKIARAIGYKDPQGFGRLDGGACIGDLIEFLEDNSGAVEALLEWIRERNVHEWHESVESQLEMDEEEEDDEDEDDDCDPLGPPDERDE